MSDISNIPRIPAHTQWQTGWNESHLALPLKQTNRYEQYDCLCMHKGSVKHLVWNCEHEVWDDSDGDDYYCDALEVTHWIPFPPQPTAEHSRDGHPHVLDVIRDLVTNNEYGLGLEADNESFDSAKEQIDNRHACLHGKFSNVNPHDRYMDGMPESARKHFGMPHDHKMTQALESDGGNLYKPHRLMVNSGQFWRCKHGCTGFAAGMEWVGCIDCQRSDPEAFAQWNEAETKAGGG